MLQSSGLFLSPHKYELRNTNITTCYKTNSLWKHSLCSFFVSLLTQVSELFKPVVRINKIQFPWESATKGYNPQNTLKCVCALEIHRVFWSKTAGSLCFNLFVPCWTLPACSSIDISCSSALDFLLHLLIFSAHHIVVHFFLKPCRAPSPLLSCHPL